MESRTSRWSNNVDNQPMPKTTTTVKRKTWTALEMNSEGSFEDFQCKSSLTSMCQLWIIFSDASLEEYVDGEFRNTGSNVWHDFSLEHCGALFPIWFVFFHHDFFHIVHHHHHVHYPCRTFSINDLRTSLFSSPLFSFHSGEREIGSSSWLVITDGWEMQRGKEGLNIVEEKWCNDQI